MNAIAALLLYGNVAVALQPPQLRRQPIHLPCPGFLIDAFLMTGMFSTYSLVNTDLYIGGLRTQSGLVSDRGRWIDVPIREHFAQRQGVIFTQLFAMHDWDMHGPQAQRRAWAALAPRIRARHNRLHPDRPVSRIAFGIVMWPQSPLGYRGLKRPGLARPKAWYVEPERP
jgi:hypothetical protein